VLTEAMNSHDVGRGRGGLRRPRRRFDGELTVAAVDSDRLYPARLSREIVEAGDRGTYRLITSPHGHDGFLIETAQVGAVVREALTG
jgi:homoserine O-acetyltransferase